MASAVSGCLSNCSVSSESFLEFDDLWLLFEYFEYQPWFFSLLGSAMVGLSGVFPLLVIPIDEAADLKHGGKYLTPSSENRFFLFLFYRSIVLILLM